MMVAWLVVFGLLLFGGIFFLVLYSTRSQERALTAVLQQQKAMRMELARLASALDSLLSDQELVEAESHLSPSRPVPENLVPGVDRLLLGSPDNGAVPSRTSAMPDLKF